MSLATKRKSSSRHQPDIVGVSRKKASTICVDWNIEIKTIKLMKIIN